MYRECSNIVFSQHLSLHNIYSLIWLNARFTLIGIRFPSSIAKRLIPPTELNAKERAQWLDFIIPPSIKQGTPTLATR